MDAAPENLVNRDFRAAAPNKKWLTDITEFQLPAGPKSPEQVRLKNEMYYHRDWINTTIEEFMQQVDSCLRWVNQHRIKLSLGGLSPLEYRQYLGIAA